MAHTIEEKIFFYNVNYIGLGCLNVFNWIAMGNYIHELTTKPSLDNILAGCVMAGAGIFAEITKIKCQEELDKLRYGIID